MGAECSLARQGAEVEPQGSPVFEDELRGQGRLPRREDPTSAREGHGDADPGRIEGPGRHLHGSGAPVSGDDLVHRERGLALEDEPAPGAVRTAENDRRRGAGAVDHRGVPSNRVRDRHAPFTVRGREVFPGMKPRQPVPGPPAIVDGFEGGREDAGAHGVPQRAAIGLGRAVGRPGHSPGIPPREAHDHRQPHEVAPELARVGSVSGVEPREEGLGVEGILSPGGRRVPHGLPRHPHGRDPGLARRGGGRRSVQCVALGEERLHARVVREDHGVHGVAVPASPGHHEHRLRTRGHGQRVQGRGRGEAQIPVRRVVGVKPGDLALLLEDHRVPWRVSCAEESEELLALELRVLRVLVEGPAPLGHGLVRDGAPGLDSLGRQGAVAACDVGLAAVVGVAVPDEEDPVLRPGGVDREERDQEG